MTSMPPRNKKLLEKLKHSWKEGLSEAAHNPDKLMYTLREKIEKVKPYKGFSRSEKKANSMLLRIVDRFRNP